LLATNQPTPKTMASAIGINIQLVPPFFTITKAHDSKVNADDMLMKIAVMINRQAFRNVKNEFDSIVWVLLVFKVH